MNTENIEETVDWPTEKGIWMAWIEDIDAWFPLRAKLLKEYPEGEPHLPMPIVAQFPENDKNWPFTFKGCHPFKTWRKPTAEELSLADKFYGVFAAPQEKHP